MNFKKLTLLAALACGALVPLPSLAANILPAGTLITGSASGASNGLLGLDHLYADEPGTNVTALAAADIEFLTGDYAAAVDFFTDGSVQFWNNTGNAVLAGSYTLTFNFDPSSPAITGFTLSDLSSVTAGTITPQVLGAHSISISFNDVDTTEFGSFSAQITTAVPEPGSFALLGAGLALLAVRRAARHTGRAA